MELNDDLFNYSNYAVDGNGEIDWFKPDYAKFENTLGITVPENYKERPLPSNMENRKDDIKVYIYIESFSSTLQTIDYWLDNSNQGRSSDTSHTIDGWIKTCSSLLKSNRLNNTWQVPAVLPWYWTNITRVTPIFLTFIELILNLPYAIARNAIPAASTYWYKMLEDWKSLSSNKFIPKIHPSQNVTPFMNFSMKSNYGTLSTLAPEWRNTKLQSEINTLNLSTNQTYKNNSEKKTSPPSTQDFNSTDSSLHGQIRVNYQEIAQVGDCLATQQPMQGLQNIQYSPKATDHPDTDNALVIYTQNIQGLKANEEKLEYISRMMESKSIDAFVIKETHLNGDFIKILPKGQLFFLHGPNVQPHQGAKGGVAIILSPEMGTNWRNGGNVIRKGETTVGDTTRLLSMNVQIEQKLFLNLSLRLNACKSCFLVVITPLVGTLKPMQTNSTNKSPL